VYQQPRTKQNRARGVQGEGPGKGAEGKGKGQEIFLGNNQPNSARRLTEGRALTNTRHIGAQPGPSEGVGALGPKKVEELFHQNGQNKNKSGYELASKKGQEFNNANDQTPGKAEERGKH